MNNRTKALSIPIDVKRAAAARDSVDGWPNCIYCGQPAPTYAPLAFSNAHYIPRSQGGLGITENILTLCGPCHRRYDQSEHRQRMRQYFRVYLLINHTGWREENLTYKKEG